MNIGVFDIETTGFLNKGGFIVEVGIAKLNLETGHVESVFDSVCREQGMTAKDRTAWIFENSDLTVEEVRIAPLLDDIMPELQEHADSFDFITAYNKRFDFDFLSSRGLKIKNEGPCPMVAATPVCKLPSRSFRGGGYKWPKVEEAWDFFFPNEPYVEQHRGLDDAMHESKIIHRLCELGHMTFEGATGDA
ncbi:exonuclease domain-containing protein [bacterium]|nr:exonuclease domain-containing protein [bacterium]